MAKTLTVEDIKDLEGDSIVHRFTGKVVKLYDQKSGENKNGEWTLQNLEMEDDEGDKIKVTLKDREELSKRMRGKELTLLAHRGNKGWSGVYAKDDDYHDKKNPDRILWVTSSAEIVEAGSADDSDDNDREDRRDRRRDRDDGNEDRRERRRERDEDDRGSRSRRGEEEDGGRERRREWELDPEQECKDFCLKRSNAIGLCMEAAFYSAQAFEARNAISIPVEFIQAITMWMAISGDRSGLFDKLPTESIFPDPEDSKKGGKGKKDEDNDDGDKGDNEDEADNKSSRKSAKR